LYENGTRSFQLSPLIPICPSNPRPHYLTGSCSVLAMVCRTLWQILDVPLVTDTWRHCASYFYWR